MICSSRSPVRRRDVDVRDLGRRQQGADELVRGQVLAQDERALLERAGQVAVDRDEDERAAVAEEALRLEAVRDRSRGVARPRRGTRPATGRPTPARSARPRGSRPRCRARTAARSAAGLSSAMPMIAPVTIGRSAVSATRQHDRRQDEREDQELEQTRQAAAATLRRDRRDRAGPAPRTRARSRSRRRPDRTGGPASHGRPGGVRRSGSSCAGLLGVWAAGGGRTEPGACVELVLEDDGRCLAIDPRPIGIALGLARRPTGSAPLHRAEAGFGEVAAQALVAQCNRKSESRRPGRRPRPGSGRPADPRPRMPRAAARRRGPRSLRASTIARRAASSSSSVRRRRIVASGRAADPSSSPRASPTRRSPRSIPSRRVTEPAEPDGAGVSIWTASETVRSTRLSKLGIEPDQSGETLISDVPNGSRIACASSIDLPRMSFVRRSGSRTATCWAEAVTGTLTVWPTTTGSPTSICDRARHELVVGLDLRPELASRRSPRPARCWR